MVTKLIDINNSFRNIRILVIAMAGICLAVSLSSLYFSFRLATESREKIYVLDNGKSLLMALSHDMSQNRPVEARSHVKQFHQLFFTLSPDGKAIEYNIHQAFNLCDRTAKQQYQNLLEAGYYSKVVSGNISQEIRVDSMALDYTQKPWQVKCFSRLTIVRPSVVQTRNLITHCFLRDVQRSDANPHGFLMERWQILENKELATKVR